MTTSLVTKSDSVSSLEATAAEKAFERLYSQSWELTKLFPEYQFRFSATLALVLGWILTSKDTQNFIATHRPLSQYGTILLTATLVVFHSRWVLRHARQLHACYAELSEITKHLHSNPKALLESVRLVDNFLPISYIIINFILCAAICLVVLSI